MAGARGRPRLAATKLPAAGSSRRRSEIAGVCLIAAGVWLFLSVTGGGGNLSDAMAKGLRGLFGAGAWLVPVLFVLLGGAVALRRSWPVADHRAWGALLGLWLVAALAQVARYPVPFGDPGPLGSVADLENARNGFGGGYLGYFTIQALSDIFGTSGRYVVLAAGVVVALLMLTDLSVDTVAQWAFGRLVALRDRMQGWRAERGAETRAAGRFVRAGGAMVAKGKPGPGDNVGNGVRFRGDASSGGSVLSAAQVTPERAGILSLLRRSPRSAAGAEPAAAGGLAGATGTGSAPGSSNGAERAPIIIHRQSSVPDAETAAGAAVLGAGLAGAAAPAQGSAGVETSAAAANQAAVGAAAAAGKAPRLRVVPKSGETGAEPGRAQTGAADREGIPPMRLSRKGDQWQLGLDPEAARDYQLPPLELLKRSFGRVEGQGDIMERARLLEATLATFGVGAKVVEVHPGPTITRFELTPEPGVKVARITSLADDLALNLAATYIRIEAPIPGKRAIGIEVPNREIITVGLRDVMEAPDFQNNTSKLAVAFGKDIAGTPLVGQLERMPHLLVAGATGSGKSVCLNTIICSILMRARPEEVKLLLIDPKRVELSIYEGVPHLAAPVVTDPRKAAGFLKWAVKEMENRYDMFAAAGVRDIARYNQWVKENPAEDDEGSERLPLAQVVIIIDELADLMMVAPVEVEDAICRLAQMARACGMHLVVATQRPSVDVITGLIKANIPSRIAFSVSAQVDSRVILDTAGAEKLMGKGDMLYHPTGFNKAVRAQCAFVSEKEVEALVAFVRKQGKSPEFHAEALEVEGIQAKGKATATGEADKESAADAVFAQAVRVVIEHGQASVSILQRRLRCNYTKGARLIDMMEERGYIGSHQGSRPRDVLISLPQWEAIFGAQAVAASEFDESEGE